MPRELVILKRCDFCEPELTVPHPPRDVAASYTVAIGPEDSHPVPVTIDACSEHDAFIKVILDALPAAHPARRPIDQPAPGIKPPSPSDLPQDCRVCGLTIRRRSGLRLHLIDVHGAVPPEYPGGKCPDCKVKVKGGRVGVHRAQTHKWDAIESYYKSLGV